MAYIDESGLAYYHGKVKALIDVKLDADDLPENVSAFTNDANYAVDASYVHTDNNYTTAEKTKLAGIEEGAQVNVVETVKVNSAALTPDANKAVDITVVEGATNGTVAVNGTDIAVHGLGTAAYTAATAYDVAGAAADVQAALLGTSADVYGTHHTISALEKGIDAANAGVNALDYTVAAGANKVLTGFEIEDGILASGSVTTTDTTASVTSNSAALVTSGAVYTAVEDAKSELIGSTAGTFGTNHNFVTVEAKINSLGTAAYVNTEGTLANDGNVPTGAAVTTAIADAVQDALDGVDVTVAAGASAALTGFEIENGALKANSVTTTAIGTVAAETLATTPIAENGTDIPTQGQVYTFVTNQVSSLGTVLNYKGSVATVSALPANASAGDVYNVVAADGTTPAGTNYAYDGNAWDPLGGTVDLSGYYTKTEIQAMGFFNAMTTAQIDAAIASA